LAVETIDIPQGQRDAKMVEALHNDLAERFPENFAGL